ncbi:polycystic kidney disease protein 1-like 2 [Brienomyrus brachyistius]|uniref:polycystic kidney disease protein 1-like 2 n=1 Tax=Brienomyrus brachyistius TaxID=42636 RepID=UPI0020B1C50C|nr:polycystic kidney disease protein 1-like 2 [Brienomyrus brachyistius]
MGTAPVLLGLYAVLLCACRLGAEEQGGGPLCPEYQKSFDTSCYEFVSLQRSFLSAQGWCERGGGHLAFVLNDETQQFLQRHLKPEKDWWLGLAPARQNLTLELTVAEDSLSWLDGSDVSYANWAEEPLPGASCAHVQRHSGFQWEATDNCSQELYFICEFESARSLACANQNATLQCGSGRVIQVDDSFYGRKTPHYCQVTSTPPSTPGWEAPSVLEECSWVDVSHLVEGHCHGLQVCQVTADAGLFGESCPRLGSYLSVDYHCKDGLLLLMSEVAAVFDNITITVKWLLHPFQGNLTCSLSAGDGHTVDPYNPKKSESMVHRYNRSGVFTVSVECSTSEWHVTAQKVIIIQEPPTEFGTIRCYSSNQTWESNNCKAFYGSTLEIQVQLEAGSNITYRLQQGEVLLAMAMTMRGIIPCNITMDPLAQQQLGIGCHLVKLSASSDMMAGAITTPLEVCLLEAVDGLRVSVEQGPDSCLSSSLQVSVSLERGSPVQLLFQVSGERNSYSEARDMLNGSLQVFSITARIQGPVSVKVNATNSLSSMVQDAGNITLICSDPVPGDSLRVPRDYTGGFDIEADPNVIYQNTTMVTLTANGDSDVLNSGATYSWSCSGVCPCNTTSTNQQLEIENSCLPEMYNVTKYTLTVTSSHGKTHTSSKCIMVVPMNNISLNITCKEGCDPTNSMQSIQLAVFSEQCDDFMWYYEDTANMPAAWYGCQSGQVPLTLYAKKNASIVINGPKLLATIKRVVVVGFSNDGMSGVASYSLDHTRTTQAPSEHRYSRTTHPAPSKDYKVPKDHSHTKQPKFSTSSPPVSRTTASDKRRLPSVTPAHKPAKPSSVPTVPSLSCTLAPPQGTVLTPFTGTCNVPPGFCTPGSCTLCFKTVKGQNLSCGHELEMKSLFLPSGDNIILIASVNNSKGQTLSTTLTTQVKDANATTSAKDLQDLVKNQQHLSKEALGQLFHSVSATLNGAAGDNRENAKVREKMLDSLSAALQEYPCNAPSDVQLTAEAVIQITQTTNELTSSAQMQASFLLANLSQALLTMNSTGSEGTAQVQLAAGVIVKAASNVLQAWAESGQQSEISSCLLHTMDNVQTALLAEMGTNQDPVILSSPDISIYVNRLSPDQLQQKPIGIQKNSTSWFSLPPIGPDILPVEKPVDVRMMSLGVSPFPKGTGDLISGIVGGLTLTNHDGSIIPVKNLSSEIEIFLPQPNESQVSETFLNLGNFSTVAINVTVPNISLVLKLDPSENLTLQLLLGFQSYPNQSHYIAMTNLPQQGATLEEQYTWVLGPGNLTGNPGTYYLLVRPVVAAGVSSINATVSVTTIASQCMYWDEVTSDWSTHGCRVGPLTTPSATQCLCNHLTFFGSSFFVMPNVVDVSQTAQLFSTFVNNPVVVCFVGAIFLAYLVVVVWARRKDIQDLAKVKVTVLADNDPLAQYRYMLTISTGHRRGASTSSQVTVILLGSDGESDPHHLSDPDKPLFERGGVDMFLLTTPFSLGELQNIRLWHDNSGSHPAWYINKVMVQDLETGQKWHFLCNSWLAINMGECALDNVFPAATELDLTRFSNLFFTKTAKDFGDGHIWFSVINRPPASNFTRVQRVSCCFSLLLCTMLTNIMFWGIPTNPSEQKMDLGQIEITWQQVMIGVQSSIIMFPINLLIVSIFRNIRPREKKVLQVNSQAKADPNKQGKTGRVFPTQLPSPGNIHKEITPSSVVKDIKRIAQSLSKTRRSPVPQLEAGAEKTADINTLLSLVEEIIQQQNRAGGDFYSEGCKNEAALVLTLESSPGGSPERSNSVSQRQRDYSEYLYRQLRHVEKELEVLDPSCFPNPRSYQQAVRQVQDMKGLLEGRLSSKSLAEKHVVKTPCPPEQENKKKCCQGGLPWWFVFVGWFLVAATSGVAAYFTMMYGLTYGKQKSISWLISMVVSFFESIFITQPLKVLGFAIFFALVLKKIDQEEYGDATIEKALVSSDPNVVLGTRRDSTCSYYKPPPPTDIERMRNNMIKEQKAIGLIMEILAYLGFMWMLLLVAYGQRDPNAYFLNQHIQQSFANGISDMMSLNDVFMWTNTTLLSNLFGQYPGFITDGNSMLVGNGRIRQVRVKRDSCPVSPSISSLAPDCQSLYSWDVEDMGQYGPGWSQNSSANDTLNSSAWTYQSEGQLRGCPIWGDVVLYRGGGFVAELALDQENAGGVLQYLFDNTWLDIYTRAVFVEFTVYNANINLFCIVTLIFETSANGAFQYLTDLQTVRLYQSTGGLQIFVMASEVIYFLFILHYMFVQGKLMKQQKWAYFSNKWNLLELGIIILSWSALTVFIKRTLLGNRDVEFYRTHPDQFPSFYETAAADSVLGYLIAFLVLLATVKLWHLLRLNPKLYMITSTLKRAWNDISGFIIVLTIMLLTYSITCNLIYGWKLYSYRTLLEAFQTIVSLQLGIFNYEEILDYNPVLGAFIIGSCVIFMTFVVLNLFISVILVAFSQEQLHHKPSEEEEIVDLIFTKLCSLLGIKYKDEKGKVANERIVTASKKENSPST